MFLHISIIDSIDDCLHTCAEQKTQWTSRTSRSDSKLNHEDFKEQCIIKSAASLISPPPGTFVAVRVSAKRTELVFRLRFEQSKTELKADTQALIALRREMTVALTYRCMLTEQFRCTVLQRLEKI